MADIFQDESVYYFAFNPEGDLGCYRDDGYEVWRKSLPLIRSNPQLADFNADGVVELYIDKYILNAETGSLIYILPLSGCNTFANSTNIPNNTCTYTNSIASDFTASPGLELAAGNKVFELNIINTNDTTGNTYKMIEALPVVADGFTSASDIDMDGKMDVIVNRNSNYQNGGGLWVWNPRTSEVIAYAESGMDGSVPFIGNLDNDCTMELGVTYKNELRVFDFDNTSILKLKYSVTTTDNSGFTGLTMFDFNQDGKTEIIYRDETDLMILDGSTGTILSSTPMNSITGAEFPIVADVDNDGEAEILVNGYIENNDEYRLYCFESDGSPWAPARAVWNQAGYHVTNVNDDLTIPRHPQDQAAFFDTEACAQLTCPQPYNSFMAQATYRSQDGCVVWPGEETDLQVTADVKCVGDSMEVCFYTSGFGDSFPNEGIPLSCYTYIPVVLDQITIVDDTTCIMMAIDNDLDSILIVINDGGDIQECDYTNNNFALDLRGPDLSIDIYDMHCTPDSVFLYIAVDNMGKDLDQQCISGGCYFSDPTLSAPVEITSWCFEYDNTTERLLYQDTFVVSLPTLSNQTEMWWTINEGGFGPGHESALITEIYECNYANNVDYISFDIGEKVLDLGPDIVKCASEVMVLNASSDFESFLWNDFTTDSIYSSSYEGLHHVEATDQCGRIYRDSVLVTFNHAQDISLGEDITLCMDEEATLDIIEDFDEVYWFPKESVNCDTCSSVSITIDSSLTLIVSGIKDNCASADTIHIVRTIPVVDTIRQLYCDGDTIDFFGQQVSETNIYSNLSPNCERLDVLDVEFLRSDTTLQERQICENDSIFFNGIYYKSEGTYTFNSQNQYGCDSLVILNLSVPDMIEFRDTLSICQGDSIHVFDQWIVRDTVLSRIESSTSGCDSMLTVNVHVKPLSERNEEVTLCDGDSLLLQDTWFSEEGDFVIQKGNQTGCDSIIHLGIRFRPDIAHYDTIAFCQGDTLDILGFSIFESTDISQSYNASNGCDSTIHIHTREILPIYTEEDIILCLEDSIFINNQWIFESGFYDLPLHSDLGCDSIHTIRINKLNAPSPPTVEVDCDNEEVIASISSSSEWNIVWDNGDTTTQTTYQNQDQALLTLSADSQCEKTIYNRIALNTEL